MQLLIRCQFVRCKPHTRKKWLEQTSWLSFYRSRAVSVPEPPAGPSHQCPWPRGHMCGPGDVGKRLRSGPSRAASLGWGRGQETQVHTGNSRRSPNSSCPELSGRASVLSLLNKHVMNLEVRAENCPRRKNSHLATESAPSLPRLVPSLVLPEAGAPPPQDLGQAPRSDKGAGDGDRRFRDSARWPRRRSRRTRRCGVRWRGPRSERSPAARAGAQGPGGRRPAGSPTERPFRAGTPAATPGLTLARPLPASRGLDRSVAPRGRPRRPRPAAVQRPSVPSGGRGGGVCSHPRDHMVTLGSQCSGR